MWEDSYQNMLGYLDAGGWVMGPLVLNSIILVFLIALKILEMRAFTRGDVAAQDCVDSYGQPGFSAAIWQREILEGFLKHRTFDAALDPNILESLRLSQERFSRRLIATIAILSTTAPLLGLLGTVSGMVNTFEAISLFGTGNAKAMASGISEALITTQTGLMIAIPGYFLATYLKRRTDKLMVRMQRFCLGLLKLHHEIAA
jgi:biopolymer transport protein ExbB